MSSVYKTIASNNRKTFFLILSFALLILGLGWIFSYIFNSYLILIIAGIISFIQAFLSYWYSDKIVLSLSGAKPIEKKDNPYIYRIVENLAITAGLPTPSIYIINQPQPNAFATGRDKNHSAIALTQGLLDKLEKSELEGVIAHELSHIKNKDILLASTIVVLVGLVALASQLFIRSLFWFGTGRKNEKQGGLGIIFLVLAIIGIILAPLVAQIIQLAISRKREFLADSSAVLLTRYPEGLIKALKKISADPNPLKGANASTAHLYIANPFRGKEKNSWFIKLFSTHPPVEERIAALEKMSKGDI
ncbi:M48 family metallopeptidase [bacterium]|nr:M48 family metallopeptidase [bacterium]